MKKLLSLVFILVTMLSYSQDPCPEDINHSNGANCNNCSDIIYVYDINNTIIDSFECNVNGGGFYNCNLEDSLLVTGGVYLSFSDVEDGSCIYDTTGSILDGNLPVELLYFDPIYKDGVVVLNWVTASERNNSHFIIERSHDGYNWNEVYTIEGHGTTTVETIYEQIDKTVQFGIIYYRLKQYDFDGAETIESIRSVDIEKRKLVKTINLIGQEVNSNYKGIVIHIYENGDQVKQFQR